MNTMNPKLAEKESETRLPTDLHKTLATAPEVEALWKDLTPIARRDFISWIDEAKDQGERVLRIEKVCMMLADGKRHP